MATGHSGSWLGLPDYGITEAIGSALGRNTTSQGGSDIFANAPQNVSQPLNLQGASVLGATNQVPQGPPGPPPGYVAPSTSGTGSTTNQTQSGPSQAEMEARAREDQARNEINSGYNSYFSQLDAMMGGLGQQKQSQEQILQNNFGQARGDLDMSKQESMTELQKQQARTEQNQAKTLRDLADSIINQNVAGSVFLGAKGAGDSSAANMYSYALNKMGAKQRGDIRTNTQNILSEVDDRRAKVNNVYTQEMGRLNTEFNNKKLEVAQWFAQQQNAIRDMRASGELSKGKDLASLSSQLLSSALNRLYQEQQAILQRKNQLDSWAQTTLNASQASGNIAQQGDYNPNLPQFQGLNGAPRVDSGGNLSYIPGSNAQEERPRSLFDLVGRA